MRARKQGPVAAHGCVRETARVRGHEQPHVAGSCLEVRVGVSGEVGSGVEREHVVSQVQQLDQVSRAQRCQPVALQVGGEPAVLQPRRH